MPFFVSWLCSERVIYARVTGLVTMEEVIGYNTELVRYVTSGEAPVHTVLHHDNITRIPRDVLSIRRALTVLDNPGMGWVVHVSQKRSPWLYAGLLMSRMTGSLGHTTTTIQDALTFLSNQDYTLPQLQWRSAGDD